MSKDWRIAPLWPRREGASSEWNVSPLVAQILYNRNIETLQAARSFLAPQLAGLHEPGELPGTGEAAELVAQAVRRGQRIVIYGDYDVDGMTGSAILWHLLRLADAQVEVYVPHRIEEGYGINVASLDRLRAEGAEMIVSVDCGIGSPEAARRARELGLTLIITDHHVPPREPPECAAIVHPTALGPSPNPYLSGAGVAFKLAWMVALKLSQASRVTPAFRQFLLDALGLAALGTVADVVPLVGENRIIAHHGLAGLPRSSIAGVQALIECAGLQGNEIDSYAVGFKLGPRLNAAGRLGHARLAVELLTRADADRAAEIARYLDHQNRARQALERRLTEQACELVEHHGFHRDSCRAIVLAAEGWHAGVLGIVAARLVESYHRPAVIIALSDGQGQGSARSIRHFELHHALDACREHLLSFGGHSMAAGLRIEPGRVEAFRAAFMDWANNRLTAADLVPRLELDAEVGLNELDTTTVQRILKLGPFGAGNPRPRLASGWLNLVGEPRRVGKSQEHLQFAVSDGRATRKAIAFGLGKHLQALRDQRGCRVAFEPIINSFRGSASVELQVQDIKFADAC
jgi:single-stranded-DNA-specific exonuclease